MGKGRWEDTVREEERGRGGGGETSGEQCKGMRGGGGGRVWKRCREDRMPRSVTWGRRRDP